MPDGHADERRARAAAYLRKQVRAALDIKRAGTGAPTSAQLQAEHNSAREEHRRVRAEAELELVPAGLSGLLITKVQRDAAVAAQAAAAVAVKRAAARRAAAKDRLRLFLDEIEAIAVANEQRAAAEAAAVAAAEAVERDAIARELRSLPAQLIEASAASQRAKNQQHADELVAEHHRPKTPNEIEAAEVERLRQLALANRRG